jgi:hypothetical protein
MREPAGPNELAAIIPRVTGAADAERAFRASFGRMCAASTFDAAADELSNMLHQLYRLSELAKARYRGASDFYAALAQRSGGDVAAAMLWARTFDTHSVVRVAAAGDVFSDYMTEMFGVLVWKPRSRLPQADPKYSAHGRDVLYDRFLDGRPVLDTSQVALKAVIGLLL